MSSTQWTVSHTQSFEASLNQETDEIELILLSCANLIENAESKSEECLNRIENLQKFRSAIQLLEQGKISRINRIAALAKTSSKFTYELEAGGWTGYYEIDPEKRHAAGLSAKKNKAT